VVTINPDFKSIGESIEKTGQERTQLDKINVRIGAKPNKARKTTYHRSTFLQHMDALL